MRRALTETEIDLLAAHPHACRMYMVVDKPTTLLSAQVNMPIASSATLINFSDEELDPATLFRTWDLLASGDTVKIGTSRNGQQLGTVALSSAGPAQLVVAANAKAWVEGLYLSVGTKWHARLSELGQDQAGNFNGGACLIPYDNAIGDYTDVLPGMTLHLGSAQGLRDLGRVRVKSITATQITVAMNSDVKWADNAYITIVESIDLWSVYPRINPDTGKFYKDEVAYTTNVNTKQTVWLPPVPIMGPPGVAFLDDDEAFLDFVGEDSYTLCSNGIKTSSTVSVGDVACVIGTGWTWPDGTLISGSAIAFGTEASPNIVKWTTSGRRLGSLNVKNDKPSGNEKSTTGYRPIFILNRPGTAEGVDEPYVNFNIEKLEGDFESGGWTATIQVFGDADIDEFPDNAMIVLFAEERWGGNPYGETPELATIQSIGGYPGRENVKAVVWIMEETTHIGFAADGRRYVEFQVQTIDGLLKAIAGYMMSVEDRVHAYGTDADTSCTDWWHVFKLQVNRVIQYVSAFHTTLHNMCDFYIANDNSRVWAWDFGDGSLYRQMDDYGATAIAGRMLCTKQSQLYIERDIQMAAASWKPNFNVLALDKDIHLREELDLPRPHRGRVRRVDLEGLLWDGWTSKACLARAPSVAPNQDGVDESMPGYIADSQSEFNEIAGYMLAAKNNPWTGLSFKFQGNFSFLDIAPQGYLTLSLLATDNKRGIAWTDKQLISRRITMNYDARAQALTVDATMDAAAGGSIGVTGGYAPPPPVVYDIPSMPVYIPPWNNVIYLGTENGIYKIKAGVKDWYLVTPFWQYPFDDLSQIRVEDLIIDPNVQSGSVNTDVVAIVGDGEYPGPYNQCLFRGHLDVDSDQYGWTKWDIDDPPNSWSDSPAPTLANCNLSNLTPDWCNEGVFYFSAYFWTGAASRAWLAKVIDSSGVITVDWMPLARDYPLLTEPFGVTDIAVDTEDGSRIYVTGPDFASPYHSGLFVVSNSLTLIRNVSDISEVALKVTVPFYRSGGSRDGDHIILSGVDIAIGANLYNAVYSTDAGATLLPLNTTPDGSYVYALESEAVNEDSFVALTATIVGPDHTDHIQSFNTWGSDWDTVSKIDLPLSYWNIFSANLRRNTPILIGCSEGEDLWLILNRGTSFIRLERDPLAIFCMAIDWGK